MFIFYLSDVGLLLGGLGWWWWALLLNVFIDFSLYLLSLLTHKHKKGKK